MKGSFNLQFSTKGINPLMICFFLIITSLQAQQGKADESFNTFDDGTTGEGFDGNVRVIIENNDETTYIAGDFLNFNGQTAARIIKLNSSGDRDLGFISGTGFDNSVTCGFKTSGGKLLYGGSFLNYDGLLKSRLARLNLDGTLDVTFNTGSEGPNNIVQALAACSDGSILVAGDGITSYNGVPVNNVFKITANGVLDIAFNANITEGTDKAISKIGIQSDGKILICGSFSDFNGADTKGIVRLNTDGSLDNDFLFNLGKSADNNILAMDVQPDGKIILGGSFTSFNEMAVGRIIRLNTDGTVDSSFNNGKIGFDKGIVQMVRFTTDGIYVGGSFTGNYNGGTQKLNRFILLKNNGDIDADFDTVTGLPSTTFYAIEPAKSGQVYIGGSFSTYDTTLRGRLAKVDKVGSLDIDFMSAGGVGANGNILKVIPLSSKKMMIFGSFTSFNGVPVNRIARLNEDGSLDATFNLGGNGASNTIRTAVQLQDGSFIIGGDFVSFNGQLRNKILKINSEGQLDAVFIPNIDGNVYAIAVDESFKIIVGGSFTSIDGVAKNRLARLNSAGSLDTSLSADVDKTVQTILLETLGHKIIIGGSFVSYNGIPVTYLVRINSDGTLDSSFNNAAGPNNIVYSIARQSGGELLIGGSFTTFGGQSKRRFLRLSKDGFIDTGFNSGIGFSNLNVRTITVQPDDRIILGGQFSGTFTGADAIAYDVRRIVRLNNDGSYNSNFTTTLNSTCFTSSIDDDGRIMIGGAFSSVTGTAKYRVARVLACINNTTYTISGWSKGEADKKYEVAIEEDLTLHSDTSFCNCSVTTGKSLTVDNGKKLTLGFEFFGNITTKNGSIEFKNNAALLQNDANAINTGTIIYNRTTSAVKDLDYVYWSSPVNNQVLADLSVGIDTFYSWYVSNWATAKSTTIMKLGKGYSVRVPTGTTTGTTQEAKFIGTPNNGNIVIASQGINKNNLIGNPYPSAINASLFIKENKSIIGGSLCFWTHNTQITPKGAGNVFAYSSGDYASINETGCTRAISLGLEPDGTIAAGQSFFVKSKIQGDFMFSNSMRIDESDKNSLFFKQAANKNATVDEKNRIWLNLTNEDGAFKQLLVGYVTEATNDFDDLYDGITLNGHTFIDFYSLGNTKNYTIQGRSLPFDTADAVPLGYKTTIAGSFKISIDKVDGVLEKQEVFLEDKLTNTFHNLKKDSFLFTTAIGTFDNRFVLRYIDSSKNLGTEDNQTKEKGIIVSVKKHQIKVNSFDKKIASIKVYDLKGSLLCEKNKLDTKEFIIDQLRADSQFMIVMIQPENGKWISKEIIFQD